MPDNAVAESFMGLFKNETIAAGSPSPTGPLRTIADVEAITMNYVDWYTTTTAYTACSTTPARKNSSRPPTLNTPDHRPATPPLRRRHEPGTVQDAEATLLMLFPGNVNHARTLEFA